MNELPTIFKNIFPQKPNLSEIDLNNPHWEEFIEHLARFEKNDILDYNQIETIINNDNSQSRNAIIYAGIARCLLVQGDMLQGAQVLKYAYSIQDDSNSNYGAFILIEMASYLQAVGGYLNSAKRMFTEAKQLSVSEYLNKIIDFRLLIIKCFTDDVEINHELNESMKYFKKINYYQLVAYHFRFISITYSHREEFDQAEMYLNKSLEIVKEHNFPHIEWDIMNDFAVMYSVYKKDKSLAEKYYKKSLDVAVNPEDTGYSNAGIGYFYLKQSNFEKALPYFKRAIRIYINAGGYSLLPSICYYMGQCYEKMEQLNYAQYFYKLGYDTAIRLFDQHIPLVGDRENAVKTYTEFLEKHSSVTAKCPEEYNYSFAIDKSLKEIRAIFQGAVLEETLKRSGSIQKTADKLEINKNTFFKIKRRIKELTPSEIPPEILEIIEENSKLSWVELNKKFEEDLLKYLFNRYDKNKKYLSEKLDMSYHRVKTLTKDFN